MEASAREELAVFLGAVRDRGVEEAERLAAEGASGVGLDPALLEVYLRRRIRYRLARSEAEGLARFLHLARELRAGAKAQASAGT